MKELSIKMQKDQVLFTRILKINLKQMFKMNNQRIILESKFQCMKQKICKNKLNILGLNQSQKAFIRGNQ